MNRFSLLAVVALHFFGAQLVIGAQTKESPDFFKTWKVADVPGVQGAWINPELNGHMLIQVDNETEKPLSLTGASTQDIASGISAIRRLTLEHLGFTHWTLVKCAYHVEKGVEKFDMEGTYVRPDKVLIHFVERESFYQKHYRQVSYLAEGTGAPFIEAKAKAALTDLERKIGPVKQ